VSVFALARMRRPALIAEYLMWCAPSAASDLVATRAAASMTREALVTAVLVAAKRGRRRV
jgi:hypothetical protein